MDRDLRELIATNIRAQIAKKQITVVAAAELAGMSREYLHRVLACEYSITVEKLVALASALDVDPCVLISSAK